MSDEGLGDLVASSTGNSEAAAKGAKDHSLGSLTRRALTVGGNMKRRVWIQKGFPWFSVPIALLEDTRLSVSERHAMLFLAHGQSVDDYETVDSLAVSCNQSIPTIRRILWRLSRLGWLERNTAPSSGGRPKFIYR